MEFLFCRSQHQYYFLGAVLPDQLTWVRSLSVHFNSFCFVNSHHIHFWGMIFNPKTQVSKQCDLIFCNNFIFESDLISESESYLISETESYFLLSF